jgi:hypothetical protein
VGIDHRRQRYCLSNEVKGKKEKKAGEWAHNERFDRDECKERNKGTTNFDLSPMTRSKQRIRGFFFKR